MDSITGLLGYVGVGLLLMTYFLTVVGHMKTTDTQHIILNVIGAVLIIITIHTGGTIPWMHTTVLWLAISIVSFWRHHMTTTTTTTH